MTEPTHDSPASIADATPGAVSEVTDEGPSDIRWFGVVLFIGHVALLVLGAVSLWRIADGGWLGGLVAGVFVVAYALLWRFQLAPGSHSRLGHRERLAVSLTLGPAVVVLGALAGLWLPALVATSLVILGDALNERPSDAS